MTGEGHRSLADGRWSTLSLVEQLANIGSEVERAIRAREDNRDLRLRHAIDRALELFDLTASDRRWAGARCREILRAREEFCRLFWGDTDPADEGWAADASTLRKYFLYFAIAARRSFSA